MTLRRNHVAHTVRGDLDDADRDWWIEGWGLRNDVGCGGDICPPSAGAAAAKRPASNLKIAASGRAPGKSEPDLCGAVDATGRDLDQP